MAEKRLYRSRTEKVFAGVCGGLAEHFGWDPTLVRIAFVVLSIFPGSLIGGLVVYVILALVIPEKPAEAGAAVAATPPPPPAAP